MGAMEGARTTEWSGKSIRAVFKENQSGNVDGVLKVLEASPKAAVTGPILELGMAPGQSGTSGIERKKHVSKEKSQTLAD